MDVLEKPSAARATSSSGRATPTGWLSPTGMPPVQIPSKILQKSYSDENGKTLAGCRSPLAIDTAACEQEKRDDEGLANITLCLSRIESSMESCFRSLEVKMDTLATQLEEVRAPHLDPSSLHPHPPSTASMRFLNMQRGHTVNADAYNDTISNLWRRRWSKEKKVVERMLEVTRLSCSSEANSEDARQAAVEVGRSRGSTKESCPGNNIEGMATTMEVFSEPETAQPELCGVVPAENAVSTRSGGQAAEAGLEERALTSEQLSDNSKKEGASGGTDENEEFSQSSHVAPLRRWSNMEAMRRVSTTDSLSKIVSTRTRVMQKYLERSRCAEAIWTVLEEPESSTFATWYTRLWFVFIMVSVCLPIFQTVDPPPVSLDLARDIETLFDAVFMTETLLRWFVCPRKIAFFWNPHNVFDMAVLVPMVIRVCSIDSPITESALLCVVPVLRLVKALRGFPNLKLVYHALSIACEALTVPLFLLLVLTLVFSTVVFVVEPRDNILSMPHAMWFVVVTVTTVGYGDTTPVTDTGKGVASLLAIAGVLYMAMPLTIVGQAFDHTWRNRDQIILVASIRQRLKQWDVSMADLYHVFRAFDVDCSGELSLEEFQGMVEDMRLGFTKQAVERLFNVFDTDNNGTIDYHELVCGVFPGCSLDMLL